MTPLKRRALTALSTLALVASVSVAKAADVYDAGSIKDEPGYSSPYIGWTGFYVGGQISGVFDLTDGDGLFAEDAVLGGGFHGGFNWQMANPIVVGLEGDIDFLDDDNADFVSSLRARLGWTNGAWMAYVTGGAAFLELVDDEDVDTGFVAGGGLEYQLENNWVIAGEALYYNFEDPNDANLDLEFWTARARLTYQLGGIF